MLTPGRRLSDLLEEWHALTIKESEAIRSLDWPRLDEYQAAKERLMSNIRAGGEMGSGPIGERVRALLALERENERDLLAARAKLETEQVVIDRASRTVRQLWRAYGSQASVHWHSYS